MTTLDAFFMEHDHDDGIFTYTMFDAEMDDPDRIDRITIEEAIMTAENAYKRRDVTGYERLRELLELIEDPTDETNEALRYTGVPEFESFLTIAQLLRKRAEDRR